MIKDLPKISARVIRALDEAIPGGKSLVPEEGSSDLNEETLIKLLKDKKKAETYRKFADKRDEMFKEMYMSVDKSFLDITKEFGIFGYEQAQEGLDVESKLSSIILDFRARQANQDVKAFEESLQKILELKSYLHCALQLFFYKSG